MNIEIVRKNSAWKRFQEDLRKGLGHAYIVIGEDSELVSSFLYFASLACFCPTICCECATCQSIAEGSHPDVFWGDGGKMKVKEDVEPMLERVEVKPIQGDKKVFIIENADKLNVVCQNKLLKTFEEPPPHVTFLLGASGESGLLATIRSRGKKLLLDTLSSEDILTELTEDGTDYDTASLSAAYGMGNLTKARLFSQGGDYRDRFEQVFLMMMQLKKSSQIAQYAVGENFTKDNIGMTLDFMEILLSDAMKLLLGSTASTCTVGRENDLMRVSSGFTAAGLAMALEAIQKAREQLNFYVNVANVANGVLFGILEARYKWQKK